MAKTMTKKTFLFLIIEQNILTFRSGIDIILVHFYAFLFVNVYHFYTCFSETNINVLIWKNSKEIKNNVICVRYFILAD